MKRDNTVQWPRGRAWAGTTAEAPDAELPATQEQWVAEFARRKCPDCPHYLEQARGWLILFVLSNLFWIGLLFVHAKVWK